jgi:hypothetical protein
VVLFFVDCDLWPSKFHLCDAFILALVTWVLDTLVHAPGDYAAVAALSISAALRYLYPRALVISSIS